MTKDRAVYIRHTFDCINRVKEYVRPSKESFFRDRKTQDAVIRNIEVIGQAVKDFGADILVAARPGVPWLQIAATRNFLALIWNIVELHLPRLENQIIEIARDEGIDLDGESNPPAMPV